MEKIFRIVDRLLIPDRGTLYTVQSDAEDVLSIGDELFDLQKNRFRISGLEMIRRAPSYDDSLHTAGLLLDGIDSREVYGDLLMDHIPHLNVLFCANSLQEQVDEEYADEFAAASVLLHCALLDFEALRNGHVKISGDPISGLTLYRGLMLTPLQHQFLYEQLAQQHIILINSTIQFKI